MVLPSPLDVVPGDEPTTATVTNTRRTGSLNVTKSVTWTGQAPPAPASFEICITGPSYPSPGSCKTATFAAFSSSPAVQTLGWANLQTGQLRRHRDGRRGLVGGHDHRVAGGRPRRGHRSAGS